MTYLRRVGGLEITIKKENNPPKYTITIKFDAISELDESELIGRLHEAVAFAPTKVQEPFFGDESVYNS